MDSKLHIYEFDKPEPNLKLHPVTRNILILLPINETWMSQKRITGIINNMLKHFNTNLDNLDDAIRFSETHK